MGIKMTGKGITGLKPLPADLNPKIFLQYEDLLKQKFVKQMRIYLADKNAKSRDKLVEESKQRMHSYSGINPKVLDRLYEDISNYEELFKVVYEANTNAQQ
jgi:hypothetical protein